MIVAERKPLAQIKESVEGYNKIIVVGCGTCVSVCMSGGEKEAVLLACQLRMAFKMEGKDIQVDDVTITRQCDVEFFDPIKDQLAGYDLIVSIACGAGVQHAADIFEPKQVFPGLNTRFIGVAEKEGVWSERCRACGDCVLGDTGGICPIATCPKSLVNGPCGGTNNGKCEVNKERDCAWTLIYNRLERQNRLANIRKIFPPKKYSIECTPARIASKCHPVPVIEPIGEVVR